MRCRSLNCWGGDILRKDKALDQSFLCHFASPLLAALFSARKPLSSRLFLTEPKYGGGLVRQSNNAGEGAAKGSGWVAVQWNPALRARYQALLAALGERFDGRIYGINLPETAIDVLEGDGAPEGFTCDVYFEAQMENIRAARAAFDRSLVVQYVNFWPCEWDNDRQYMSRLFELGKTQGIGMGGPDIIPYRRAQEKNAYQFLESMGKQLRVVAMAVQGPTLTYTNPETGAKFTRAEFEDYAVSKLNYYFLELEDALAR